MALGRLGSNVIKTVAVDRGIDIAIGDEVSLLKLYSFPFAPQLSELINKSVVSCIIFGAIAIYAIVAVLG